MEISSTVDEEEVSDIFVRINSKGKQLNQADFILTLLSVFWDEGRKQLEEFCKKSRIPSESDSQPNPYNNFIKPHPDHLLRVAVGLGFKRARLKSVYSVLRGKDMDTGNFTEELRDKQFEILKIAQNYTLNLQNWHEFMKVLVKAGFRSNKMISSETTLLYAYVMYLIGKIDYKIDLYTLRNLIAKWYFMIVITSRYTSSPETVMERDLARLRGITDKEDFIKTIQRVIDDSLTNDFWTITLVNNLETSSAQSPALFAYYASLNLLEANVLFSKMKVSELIDPLISGNRKPIERHHLFPRAYLKSIGINETRIINQVANYALVEWGDNNNIADNSPKDYFPQYASRYSEEEFKKLMEWHALPDGWEDMDYNEFLERRRLLMAKIIQKGFTKLSET